MKHLYSLLVGLAMTGTIMAQTVLVTLSVDMSNQDVAAEGIHVAGDFQGWDPRRNHADRRRYGWHL